MNSNLNNKTAKGWRKRRIADKVEEVNIMTVSTVTVDDYNDTTKQKFIRCPICYDQPREWVGLTDDEVRSLMRQFPDHLTWGIASAIEAKLKEKNT